MSNKKIAINLLANSVSFIVALGISLVLTPYIVKTLGSESYGLVSLANSFVTYISLVTVALNSMAGRFVSVKIHQNDMEGANRYFSSVVIANIVIAALLILPSILVITFLDKIINVPIELINDARVLFALVLLGFLISIITSLFSIALFATNNLYLSALRNIEGGIIRAAVTFLLFSTLPTRVYYIGLVNIIFQVYIAVWNLHYTRTLLSELKVNKKFFNSNAIKELISSGIWNTVNQLSAILNEGLDLLISNLLLGATPMGILAIAKTIPSMILQVLGIISVVFAPDFTKLYAKGQFDEMINLLNRSIKLLGIFINIPIAGLIVFGDIFYELWMPSQDAKTLQVLSIITIGGLIISGSTASVYDVFTATNKVKMNSIVTLGQGVVNIIIVLILLNVTNLGVYAVAGTSTLLTVFRNLFFTFPYAARCIRQKWYVLYFPAFKSSFSVLIVSLVCLIFKKLFIIDTWYELLGFGVMSGIIGVILNIMIILSKNEKKYILSFLKRKLKLSN